MTRADALPEREIATGSHVCIGVLDAALDVVVVDNLFNSGKASLERVRSIWRPSLVFRRAPTFRMKRPSATYSAPAE